MKRLAAAAGVAWMVLCAAAPAADRPRPDLEVARLTGAPVKVATGLRFTDGGDADCR